MQEPPSSHVTKRKKGAGKGRDAPGHPVCAGLGKELLGIGGDYPDKGSR